MAKLQQQSGLTYYQGWYGLCSGSDDDCSDFPLVSGSLGQAKKLYPAINKIYEVRGDSLGQISYDGTAADGFPIHFGTTLLNKLKCGHCYRIILSAGSGSVDIPHFTFAHQNTTEKMKIIDECAVAPTPTPKKPTPTPTQTSTSTQTPTPEDCCKGTDFSYTIVKGQSGGDNNVTVRTQGMNSQDPKWDGTLCWEKMKTNSNDVVNYIIDLRASSSSTTSLGMINIILSAKYENQKFYYTLKSSGICYTGEMKNTNELSSGQMNVWTPV